MIARGMSSLCRSTKPSPFEKAPRAIVMKNVVGNTSPTRRPAPVVDETGSISPEKFTAGIIVTTAVAKIAATWLRMKLEISRPMAVAVVT